MPRAKTSTMKKVEIRIKGGPNAKVFTTLGPARQGSVVMLPAAEADALIEAERAVLSDKELLVRPLEGALELEQDFEK